MPFPTMPVIVELVGYLEHLKQAESMNDYVITQYNVESSGADDPRE